MILCAGALPRPSAAAPLLEKQIVAPGPLADLPFSPGVLVGETLYVSGLGSHHAEERGPVKEELQRCLSHLQRVLEAAGMDHSNLVFLTLYLTDLDYLDSVQNAFRSIFSENPPAGTFAEVAGLPENSRIQIDAIAVQDSVQRTYINLPRTRTRDRPLFSAGVRAGGIVYLSSTGTDSIGSTGAAQSYEAQVRQGLLTLGETLATAGLGFEHLVFVGPDLVGTSDWSRLNRVYRQFFPFDRAPARATQTMQRLPQNRLIQFHGVAVTNRSQRKVIRQISHPPLPTASPGILAGNVLYTSAFRSFLPVQGGSAESGMPMPPAGPNIETQMHLSLRNVHDCLLEAGLTFDHVVRLTVYLKNIGDYERAGEVVRQYFPASPPAVTMVQPSVDASGDPSLVQSRAIAIHSTGSLE